jgi:hypothetical protein
MLPLDVLCVTVVVAVVAVDHLVAAVLAPRPVVRLASCLLAETVTMIAVVVTAATAIVLAARMSATVTPKTSATARTLAIVMTTVKGSVNPSVTLNARPSTLNVTSAMPNLTALSRRSTRASINHPSRSTLANDFAEHEAPPAPQHDDLDTAE